MKIKIFTANLQSDLEGRLIKEDDLLERNLNIGRDLLERVGLYVRGKQTYYRGGGGG